MMARSHRRRLVLAGVLAAALVGTGSPAAHALWQATASASATLSAGSAGAPSTPTCASITSPRVARLAWPAVTGAVSYSVLLTRDSNGQQLGPFSTATPTIDITSGLLGGLEGLLAGAMFTAQVRPVYTSSAWVGGLSPGVKVKLFSILGGMECG